MIRKLLSKPRTTTPTEFRWRSSEVSRLEELSDAVIGFALTLLVVSLEVPQTFDELLQTIRGFPAFGLCFALLIVIWYEHYTFFRRYGLQDTTTIVWNTVFLFLIVFYVYPLKFLFTLFSNEALGMSMQVTSSGGDIVPMIEQGQLSQLYLIYGIGWSAVWLVFVLLYRHALKHAEHLKLNPLEVFDTQASIGENVAAVCVGLASIALTFLGATGVAGWVYLVMFPLTWVIKRRNALRRHTLETRLTPVSEQE
ncbi:MAG TPA: TMEM175 family protein [Anaerolineales bacterium]|nr:TMEM175 family protein [Anaerolineales bacterium]